MTAGNGDLLANLCVNPTPPHLSFRLTLRLFWLKKTISGLVSGGLRIEHTFTGKNAWLL